MNIVVTGSLGNISKPLTLNLIQKGHSVTVISSNPERQKNIESLGAIAAIGSLEDAKFLTQTFTGADAAYCMVPPNFSEPDQIAYYMKIGNSYAKAIKQSGIKRVVELSSYGAHLETGTGFIVGSYKNEQLLNTLESVSITHIRPGYFYYNLLHFIGMVKAAGFIGTNFGGEDKLAMVSPQDIATAIAEELLMVNTNNNIRYVASDDRSCNEVAAVIGKAIGKPNLEWKTLSNEQTHNGMIANGMTPSTAATLVELGAATHSGALREDYDKHQITLGKVKIENYAKEFAQVFNRQ